MAATVNGTPLVEGSPLAVASIATVLLNASEAALARRDAVSAEWAAEMAAWLADSPLASGQSAIPGPPRSAATPPGMVPWLVAGLHHPDEYHPGGGGAAIDPARLTRIQTLLAASDPLGALRLVDALVLGWSAAGRRPALGPPADLATPRLMQDALDPEDPEGDARPAGPLDPLQFRLAVLRLAVALELYESLRGTPGELILEQMCPPAGSLPEPGPGPWRRFHARCPAWLACIGRLATGLRRTPVAPGPGPGPGARPADMAALLALRSRLLMHMAAAAAAAAAAAGSDGPGPDPDPDHHQAPVEGMSRQALDDQTRREVVSLACRSIRAYPFFWSVWLHLVDRLVDSPNSAEAELVFLSLHRDFRRDVQGAHATGRSAGSAGSGDAGDADSAMACGEAPAMSASAVGLACALVALCARALFYQRTYQPLRALAVHSHFDHLLHLYTSGDRGAPDLGLASPDMCLVLAQVALRSPFLDGQRLRCLTAVGELEQALVGFRHHVSRDPFRLHDLDAYGDALFMQRDVPELARAAAAARDLDRRAPRPTPWWAISTPCGAIMRPPSSPSSGASPRRPGPGPCTLPSPLGRRSPMSRATGAAPGPCSGMSASRCTASMMPFVLSAAPSRSIPATTAGGMASARCMRCSVCTRMPCHITRRPSSTKVAIRGSGRLWPGATTGWGSIAKRAQAARTPSVRCRPTPGRWSFRISCDPIT
ncbi:hypothetical protein H696_05549 [Fonticula alba]|uniref:Uncharacterized protein n=1 Tax=Fonticula alba TaxID=691883 RepID=A0A058Z2R4_FONAL|nr:hypothetical protein H696_05549 [Fonticula alba]KCV67817.1 hypothetical protein H696_05549 [Fonticula alba]|eukprot:XP_009497637.1 hypothetical protein H696_05549 [Fonticula alba]